MLTIGAHLSIAKGFAHAAETALAIGANTFQFFSRNPRGSSIKAFNAKDIERFQEIREKNAFGPIMAHAPYTLNLASARPDVYTFSQDVIRQDILRMDSLGIEYFNFHPGSPGDMGFEAGLKQIVDGLNAAITGQQNITVLLETMSGRSNEIGGKFEHLHAILTGVNETAAAKMGICLDLCHVFSAGYDIACHLDDVLTEFDRVIGLEHLKAIHLNDSMMEFGAGKDRHALIGQGHIGMDAILGFLRHPLTRGLPYYLETPLDDDGHKEEIAMIKDLLYNDC